MCAINILKMYYNSGTIPQIPLHKGLQTTSRTNNPRQRSAGKITRRRNVNNSLGLVMASVFVLKSRLENSTRVGDLHVRQFDFKII